MTFECVLVCADIRLSDNKMSLLKVHLSHRPCDVSHKILNKDLNKM